MGEKKRGTSVARDVVAVGGLAAVWRLACVALTSLLAGVVPPYDSSALIDPSAVSGGSAADAAVARALGPLAHWDGVFYTHIAQHGYTYEMFHAFFPGLPLAIRGLSLALSPLLTTVGLSERSIILISGVLFTNLCAVGATVMLYMLSRYVLNSRPMALAAAAFFAVSPGNVFFSAVYSESPFALASFTGMYLLESVASWSQQANPAAACVRKQEARMPTSAALGVVVSTWGAGLAFAAAGALRSNGMLLAGYLVYSALRLQVTTRGPARGFQWFLVWGSTVGAVALTLAPFAAFQLYGKSLYCTPAPELVRTLASELGVHLPSAIATPDRPWCTGGGIPNMYGFIQKEYWGVGPFEYYVPKQIPQFILASPMLAVAATVLLRLALENGGRLASFLGTALLGTFLPRTTGLADPPVERDNAEAATPTAAAVGTAETDALLGALGMSSARHRGTPTTPHTDTLADMPTVGVEVGQGAPSEPLLEAGTLPYAGHMAVMLGVAVVIMHIQVVTRFLASSSPLVYWYLASLVTGGGEHPLSTCSPGWRAVAWVALYGVLGPLLFGNFQNWT